MALFPSRDEWLQAVRYGIIFAILAFFTFNLPVLLAAIFPFALALAISLLLEPVVVYLATRLRLGRAWATFLVLSVLALAGVLFLTWVTTILVDQINTFILVFPRYKETVETFIEGFADQVLQAFESLPPEVLQYISENTNRFGQAVQGVLTAVGGSALSLLTALPGLLTAGFFVLLATFFTSKDLPRVKDFLWRLVPQDDQGKVRTVLSDLMSVALRYLKAQALLIAITTVVTTIGLLVVGVNNWFAAGLVIGLLDLLPVVGPTLVFAPWIGYLLIVGQSSTAIGLLIVYAVASAGRTLIEAKVIGDSVGLHPLATLLALYSGALLWGIPGAILGPVVFLIAKAILKAWHTVDAG